MAIKTIEEFLAEINNLDKSSEYLYRGQADKDWYLRSGAARKVYGSKTPDEKIKTTELVMFYCEYLLTMAKNKRHHHRKDIKVNDLELLAELQHYEAATLLLDFTRNPLASLWFACCSEEKKNGTVFIIDQVENNFQYVHYNDVETFSIGNLLKNPSIYIWEPSHINERIPVQSSVFLFGQEPLNIKKIKFTEIDKDSKKDILEKLDKLYGMNENYFFPDFYGFAKANRASSPSNFLRNFSKALNEKSPQERVQLCNNLISENRIFYMAYVIRGVAYTDLKKYNEAIKDYEEAIKIKPDHANTYFHRGNTYMIVGNHQKARQDFEKAKELAIQQKNDELLKNIEAELKDLDDLEAGGKKSSEQ